MLIRSLRKLGDVDLFMLREPGSMNEELLNTLRSDFNLVGQAAPPKFGERGVGKWMQFMGKSAAAKLHHHINSESSHYRASVSVAAAVADVIGKGKYDAILARPLLTASLSGAFKYPPLVVDIDDVDYDVWKSRLNDPTTSWKKKPFIAKHYLELKRLVPKLAAKCDLAFVCTKEDRDQLGMDHIEVLPNVPFEKEGGGAPPVLAMDAGSQRVISIGSLGHVPNVLAVDFFVQEVWPRVRSAMPEATYRVIGSHMTREQKERWSGIPGVVVVGLAPDLTSEYQQCAFTVASILSGSGTNIKVVESLAYGRTCVITRHAQRGYEETLKNGESLFVADNREEMAARCIELLQHSELRNRMATEGAARVREHYSFDRFSRIVTSGVSDLLRHGGKPAQR